MKVLWLSNIPSPYRVDFFNELGKNCQLTVLFERKDSAERDHSWKTFHAENFQPIVLSGIKTGVDGAFCPQVVRYLKKNYYDEIIVTNFSSLTGMLAVAWMQIHRIAYSIESDGGFAGNPDCVRGKVKRWLFSRANWFYSTAAEHDRYYTAYGVPMEKIIRYPFTSVHEEKIITRPLTRDEKLNLRRKLDIPEKKVILAVGQFIPRKGFDLLLQACRELDSDTGCYLMGGVPDERYLHLADGMDHVHFVGFVSPQMLDAYYKAADVFVLPTREDIWGLVVNEALARALPVITTDRCIAGTELIRNGENGYLIPADRADLLLEAIRNALDNPILAQGALRSVRGYTLEKMAQKHWEVFAKHEQIQR